MDIDSFWTLIDESRQQARSQDDRLVWLRGELSHRPVAEIVQFQALLDDVTDEAFTWDLWAAAERILGWCSDDGFCYFGLWMVGLGREAFSRAVATPDALSASPEVQHLACQPREKWSEQWPEWEALDYVAQEAYGIATGSNDDCAQAFYAALKTARRATGPRANPLGAYWDARREDLAADKLPRLSSLFPVRPAI
ncbi:DUF4240 domain-containing protein [Streptomyces crystallinus]|uniref:DUF4240 domain-containing protein n=1 Tax=Streptomyces crystallinus TaxID=68191 RepID=UPI0031D9DFA4